MTAEYLPLAELIDQARQARPSGEAGGVGEAATTRTFVVGIAGGVAVGKTTTARELHSMLASGRPLATVERVSTDAFLLSNTELERRQLTYRKGFPESYDLDALQQFLAELRVGSVDVTAPVYDHVVYDIVPGARQLVGHPEVLLLEGCNVLQEGIDVDFGIYLDAATSDIRRWFVERFIGLARQAADEPGSFFASWSGYRDEELTALAGSVWEHINEVNLHRHILPTRERADVVVRKDADHRVVEIVELRCAG